MLIILDAYKLMCAQYLLDYLTVYMYLINGSSVTLLYVRKKVDLLLLQMWQNDIHCGCDIVMPSSLTLH